MHDDMSFKKERQFGFPWVLCIFLVIISGDLVLLGQGVSSASAIGCYLIIGLGIFLPIEDLLCLIAVAIPTGNIFKLGYGYTSIPFLILIYILKSLVKNGRIIKSDSARPLIWVILLFFMSVFTSMMHHVSVAAIIPFYMHLIFIVVALRINHVNDEETFTRIAFYFVVGTLVVCIGTLLFPSVSRSLSNISVYSKSNGGFSSTWDFGRSLNISIAFVILSYLKTKKHFLFDLGLTLIMLYFLIQCGRFSMLLGLGAVLICLPFAYGGDRPLRVKILYTIIMIFVVSIVSFIAIRYAYSAMVDLRGVGASDNGRFNLWNTYISYLSKNPSVLMFGTGGGTISSIANILGLQTAHNILLEKIVEFGVIGLLLLTAFFRELYRRKTLLLTKNINVLPLIAFLATALTQGTTGNAGFALLIALCAADIQYQ